MPNWKLINDFFADENLTLPPGKSWRNVKANIFKVVDGKKLLFEKEDSLFQSLRSCDYSPIPLELTREIVAANMKPDEIHEDVYQFFAKLKQLLT